MNNYSNEISTLILFLKSSFIFISNKERLVSPAVLEHHASKFYLSSAFLCRMHFLNHCVEQGKGILEILFIKLRQGSAK